MKQERLNEISDELAFEYATRIYNTLDPYNEDLWFETINEMNENGMLSTKVFMTMINPIDEPQTTLFHLIVTFLCEPIYFPCGNEILDAILKSENLDINICDGKKRTVLHTIMLSFADYNLVCIKKLLQHKNIDVNARDANGRTPLALCCTVDRRYDNLDIGLLVEHPKIDLTPLDTKMKLPWDFSSYHGDFDPINIIVAQIVKRLQCNNLSKLHLIPSIYDYMDANIQKLNESISITKYLERITLQRGESWDLYKEGLLLNKSIIGLMENPPSEDPPEWLTDCFTRNQNAYDLCQRTTIFTTLMIKRAVCKDIGFLIGQIIWESRGDEIWFKK